MGDSYLGIIFADHTLDLIESALPAFRSTIYIHVVDSDRKTYFFKLNGYILSEAKLSV